MNHTKANFHHKKRHRVRGQDLDFIFLPSHSEEQMDLLEEDLLKDERIGKSTFGMPVEQFLSLGSLANVFLEKCVQPRQVRSYHGNRDFDFLSSCACVRMPNIIMQVQFPSPNSIHF
jgi:hypothetical protein